MMKHLFLVLLIIIGLFAGSYFVTRNNQKIVLSEKAPVEKYWFILHRKSFTEDFFYGIPGDKTKSKRIKTFTIKPGIPKERPTPLPKLLGREYWLITEMHPEMENPETAPYFLTLDIPSPSEEPYGPVPYTECNGEQCHWFLPGAFGLHGTGGDPTKITADGQFSSGCIRHFDEDITYLYNLLKSQKEEIRYYVEDN